MNGNGLLSAATLAALGANAGTYYQQFTINASPDGVTAATGGSSSIIIVGGISFFTERVSISYPTTNDAGGGPVDDYVTRLTLQLSTATMNKVFTAPLPLQLIAVPGRMPVDGVLDPGGLVAPGQPPHIPGWPLNLFLPGGTEFSHNFSNTSRVPAVIDVAWHGWNMSKQRVPSEQDFWDIVARHQPGLFGS